MLGIGVNVAVDPSTLPPDAAAVAGTLGLDPTRSSRRSPSCCVALERAARRGPRGARSTALRERDALLGQPVRWQDGEGTGAGIDDTGALLVQPAGRDHDRAERGRGHPPAGLTTASSSTA